MEVSGVVKQGKKPAGKSGFARWLRRVLIFAAVIAVAGIGAFVFSHWTPARPDNPEGQAGLFTVTRGDLSITVTESGDIKALNSIDIKSEVEGQTTIISIVDEGTIITLEDVNNGKILVELDSSDIKEKLTQQEITFLRSEAELTEAKEALDIQQKQNVSDLQAGRMKVRFALIDFKKYLGKAVAEKVIKKATGDPNSNIDMAVLLNDPQLGGSASQKLKELADEIVLAESKFQQASDTLMWTEKLYEKQYVVETKLKEDQLELQSCEIKKEKAEIALELFKLYEFPKETEKLLNDYNEAKLELERIEASARSKLAQAQARLKSREATYSLQKERLEKLQKQLDACVIRVPAPGQVVYASSMGSRWERRNRPIEIGAEIRERQKIISIPDPTAMKVEIKVHETWVDKVQPDQQAKITVAAFPDKTFTGKVLKKAPLADPEEWLNPDHKVYRTDVSVDGTHESLKTGMTAKVEVIIDELQDVLSVPIQTVVTHEGTKLCYVMTDGGSEKREVETGAFNNDFVEIKGGLAEGEKVLLNPPRITELEATRPEG